MPRPKTRTGSILVVTMVVLLVISLIAVAMVQLLMLQARQGKRAEQRQQAAWLAESAVARAEIALRSDANYFGETLLASQEMLGGSESGTVAIRVESTSAPNPGRRVLVVATYPETGVYRNQIHRQHFVALERRGETP